MSNALDLTARLAELLRREHAALADFLLALADFDRKKLWREVGHASLFYFLHRELGLSKGAACYRKTAAELVQRFPEIVDPLRDGRLCMTSIVELAKVITSENREEVLPRFFHCSKREAKAVSAEIRPAEAAPHRDVVTAVRAPGPQVPDAVPAARAAAMAQAPEPPIRLVDLAQTVHLDEPRPTVPAGRGQRDLAEPLTADLRRLHVTVTRRFLAKLDAARAALSHSRPEASTEEVLEAGLDLLLALHAKRKGLVSKPRREPPPSKPDHLPAHVRREVWTRDGGRCQWKVASGGICGSTLRVQFDHVVARARGGPSTVDNVRLLCALTALGASTAIAPRPRICEHAAASACGLRPAASSSPSRSRCLALIAARRHARSSRYASSR